MVLHELDQQGKALQKRAMATVLEALYGRVCKHIEKGIQKPHVIAEILSVIEEFVVENNVQDITFTHVEYDGKSDEQKT